MALRLNDEAMVVKDRDDFQRLLEKLIDVNVAFSPTPVEAGLIALGDSDPISQQVRGPVETLAITNIRVVCKIAALTKRLSKILQAAAPEIIERAVRSVTLAGWAVLEPDRAPRISDLRLHNSIGTDRREEAANLPVQEANGEHMWAERVTRLGFDYADDFVSLIFDGGIARLLR